MTLNPIDLQIFNHRFAAIAEEMGVALCRSAFSANIKERRDFSCALFDAGGELVAQAAHIPVHLGSTALSVRAAIDALPMDAGDVVMLNDPFAGGTHLPDVTVVAPVFLPGGRRPFAYVANRAHHADIGGGSPGSMALATEIYQEGLRLPPVHLVRAGVVARDVMQLFLANTRVTEERRGDLLAQLAALRFGARRMVELVDGTGRQPVQAAMRGLKDYSERLMRAALGELRAGTYRAVDYLDDDGFAARRIPIRVRVKLGNGEVHVDFTGSSPQVPGGVNANYAVTVASVLYTVQILSRVPIPSNAGVMRPIRITVPPRSIVNAAFPAAVAGGNVETSQRIVDVLLCALAKAAPQRVPAASQGTMNNFSFGGTRADRDATQFAYYETIAGGAGAGPLGDGASAVHTHMTNTLNTPIEALEASLPVRVTHYGIRAGSGGAGEHRGGDGVIREVEYLASARVTLLSERRVLAPYGLRGGADGKRGKNSLIRRGRAEMLPGKVSVDVKSGERIRIETPGGGGWGKRR